MSIKFLCVTLPHMSIGSRVVLAVTFQKVDNAPDTKTCAQGHYESLQNTNCTVEKFHKIILLKNVFDFGLSCCVNLVHIEGVHGFYHGTLLLYVPFHVKDIFRVGVGRVSVIRVSGEVVLVRKERAHAPQHEDTLAAVHHCQFVLGHQLLSYEALHPGYDEYRFDLDEIEHDPYVLVSILTAFHEGVFTIDEVQAELQMLFEKRYILTQTVEVEVRYRTETRTDSEGNDYDVKVPYNYYICKVKLENFDLSHVPVYIMDEETLSLYAVYMATLGNREDLFPGSGYVDKYTKPPTTYDILPSALEDETFAALITEAEKYIGYPYVWGGSNPNTSFDCSGFVSWVLTQSGVCNTGRLGAQGLYNISTPVSSANARPGDLIFFVGTYDTPGVSHVGIYVGGRKMLHCGDPIQYADINTSYWQSHFYAFGRPPYN